MARVSPPDYFRTNATAPLDLALNQELDRLEQLRRQHLALLEALDASGWQRTGRHGDHGMMSVELYETHVAAEEVDHLAQIARLL
jgi:hypothetical protein